MRHYGDITKLSGYELPVVDVITGGSPCQDLSVAGKRAGLAGERSGLFMEQIRIVKEMRERERAAGRTGRYVRPRYMVWENVPGAFSSAGGADFAAVLEEIIKVCEPGADVCVPVPSERWTKSGCYYTEDGAWSIAWRVHDAQFWGVPQRRKRIALVADFGGLSAPEILFERKGVSGDSEPCGTAREETAGAVGDGVEGAEPTPINTMIATRDKALGRGTGFGVGEPGESAYTISAAHEHAVFTSAISFQERAGKPGGGKGILIHNERTGALSTLNNQSVFCLQGNGIDRDAKQNGDPCHPLAAGMHHPAVAIGNGQLNQMSMAEQANTLDTMHDQQAVLAFTQNQRNEVRDLQDCAGSLAAEPGMKQQTYIQSSVVRRLTPLECERLQGYPDGWTDIGDWTDSKGKKHKEADSPRYKALGNSIALPFWQFLARRICAQYERDITMASLFDGIGGFPLVFERCGAKAVWASEIEEFPIAVTKKHFPEEEQWGGIVPPKEET